MSNIFKALSCVVLMLVSLNTLAEPRIGYVQVDKILKEAPQTADTGRKLEAEFRSRSLELKKIQQNIKAIETELENKPATLSSAERKSKQQQASRLRFDFNRKQRVLREDINIRKNDELAALQDRINEAVKTVSEAGGYDLVMYSGVAYASPEIDLTDKVLKLLSEQ